MLQVTLERVAQIHFLYVLTFGVITILYDAWMLIAPTAVLSRWIAGAVMLVVTTIIWYIDRGAKLGMVFDKALIGAFVVLDIAIATFVVYTERGMASRGVALYAIPLVVTAFLQSRAALFATASISAAAYALAAESYFVVHFNEGYKIELYSTIALYSALFFLLAAFLAQLIGRSKS